MSDETAIRSSSEHWMTWCEGQLWEHVSGDYALLVWHTWVKNLNDYRWTIQAVHGRNKRWKNSGGPQDDYYGSAEEAKKTAIP